LLQELNKNDLILLHVPEGYIAGIMKVTVVGAAVVYSSEKVVSE
jgi:hypothetical protein